MTGPGKVSHEKAQAKAEKEYDLFAERRRNQIENQAEADAFQQLETEVKKLPPRKKPKGKKS